MKKLQKICVTGFLNYDDLVLVVRRSQHETFLPGYYEMPGGKVEFGETPEGALIREFREEVGLNIVPGKPYKAFSYISGDGNRHTVDISYAATLRDPLQSLTLSKAHDNYRWINEAEVASFVMTDEMRDAILAGFKRKKGQQ